MRSSKPAIVSLLLLAFAILSLPGCGSGVTAANNVTAISITATSTTVPLNGQTDFTAQVTLANSTITTNTAVTWQVNGTTGGSSSIGTIEASSTDVNVGIYTAPAVAPTTNVNVTAIITQSTSSTGTATTTITSNTISLTIGAGTGVSITPTGVTVHAGQTYPFTAEVNNVVDSTGVAWSVSSTGGGNIGSINSSGDYTAPGVPPPGGVVTITATYTPAGGTAETATATATIVYSDASLQGPLAFSYTGNNASGLISVAGHFVADGAGTITSGVEDITSFGSRVKTRVPFLQGSSYTVGGDGRTRAVIVTDNGTETWEFVVTSTQHAVMTRFDNSVTASGTIDQQSLNALGNNIGAISGNYVFRAAGGDAQLEPMGVAGRFTANGSGGIPQLGSIVDVNDNTTVTKSDTTLTGSYSLDAADAGTGRGTLTLSSTSLGSTPLQFAFYVVGTNEAGNTITQMHIVEIDQVNYLVGDIYSAPAGSSFAASSLGSGNYVFVAGGNASSEESYAAGGVFTSDGNGNISGGVLDTNNAGTATADATVNSCPYSVDSTTGRIDMTLSTTSGACTPGAGSPEFAVYQTAQNSAVMLELDSSAFSGGTAYLQAASPTSLSGHFALAFVGQGIFDDAPGSYQSNASGQAVLAGAAVSSGNLDIDTFGTIYASDPITSSSSTTTTGSSIQAPGTNGRGTATIVGTDPPATYTLAYYVVNANTALFVGQDKARVETGIMILQY